MSEHAGRILVVDDVRENVRLLGAVSGREAACRAQAEASARTQ